MVLAPEVVFREEDLVLFHRKSGEILSTNEIGFTFAMYFKQPGSFDAACEAVALSFGVSCDRVQSDFSGFYQGLLDTRLLISADCLNA